MQTLKASQTPTPEPGPIPVHLAGGFNLAALAPDTLLNDEQAAAALSVKPGTLSVWRCTGRYNLPFVKVGRLVRYRAGDLAAWLDKRARLHSGQ